MPAPTITAFGDGDHEVGATGLVVDGVGFDPFATDGRLWMNQNSNPNSPGLQDELTFSGGDDQQLTGVAIPASPNNVSGTVYLFFERIDGAFSDGFAFVLTSAAGSARGRALSTGRVYDRTVRPHYGVGRRRAIPDGARRVAPNCRRRVTSTE